MKRLSLVLTILVTLLNVHLYAATFTASKVEITPGQTAQLVIGMNNTDTNLSGFQFKLYLPEGLSVTTNNNGQFVYTQSGRIANHTVNFRALNDGGYLVVVYSMDANVITGSSGELMSISVTADKTASTSGNGTLSNIRITDVSSSTSSCDDVTFSVTLAANVIDFADANVKALCVANWDKNGDGELSEAEAASVTDLGTVFKSNRTITSFNELQYFTGLTSIGNSAFESCFNLTAITIPESVTSIGSAAFFCCGLTSITIPESVTNISQRALGGCNGLTSIKVETGNTIYDSRNDCNAIIETATNTLIAGCKNTVIPNSVTRIGTSAFYGYEGLTSITIPNSVTSIGYYAFSGCSSLTSVTIPSSVTSIGVYAFADCSGLTSITIPGSVTSIGDGAFSYCRSLTSVTIPNSVTSIGDFAFGYCTDLTSIKVEGGNAKYDSRDNCNAIIETATNTLITGCQNTVIPNSVTNIGVYAFASCSGLTSITIPNSVTSIGDNAFSGCNGLTSVIIPSSVTSIGDGAFYWCSSLTSITIPNSVTSIGYGVFSGNSGLTSVISYIEEPFEIESDVFNNNTYSTATLYVPVGTIEAYQSTDGWKNFQNIEVILQPLTIAVVGNGTVQYGDTSVRSSSQGFDVAESSNVVLTITPDAMYHVETLTINGEDALSRLTEDGKLTIESITASVSVAVTFAANVIDFADAGVKALCVANWDTNSDGELDEAEAAAVTDIGTVFHDNQTITSFDELQYFTGLTNIGKYAFEHCHSLTSVTIPNSVVSIGEYAFHYCESLTSIPIPNSVTSIGEYAFFSCIGLTSITIPNSVTSIASNAFGCCSSITSITVETGNTTYDSRNDCNAIIETATNTLITGCQNTVIPNSVTRIGKVAFYGCNGLTSVTIPNSVTSISYFAFFGCDGLTSLTIPESVKSVESSAVVGCSGLTSIKVETGNTKYDSRNDCNAIIETASNKLITGCQNTVIPNSVTAIDQNAFNGCSGLTSIIIPSSVKNIEFAAFQDCSGLTSITIPNSVTSIETWAFNECRGLTSITSYVKEPFAIDNDVFEGILYETATLFVPAGSVDAYKTTDGWKNFQNIETIHQQLTIAVVGDGTVTFSDEALTNTTATFKVGGEVHLQLIPDEGCHIERVVVNQQDCTSEVTDGVLTLNITDEDFFVLAEFQHDAVPEPTYVNYTIYIDGPGNVRVKGDILDNNEQTIQVPQGSDLVLEFLPDEGQMVDKVTCNGETVTDQVLGNTFVVRNVQEDGTVSVIFMERIETFEYAGIRYGVTDNTQRIVKVLPYDYSGHLSIPASFEHSQRTWQVQEIGSLAFANCEWLVSVKIPASISQAGKNLFKRDTRLAAIQWDAELPLRTEVTGALTNANMLYYVKDKSYAPQGGNVIVNGMADNISLSDGHDFYCPEAFKAKKVAYSHNYRMLTRRGYCQGWETLALPFNVKTIRLSRSSDNNPEIYPYESLTDDEVENKLPFWLYSYGDDDKFAPAASIEANTPYIISMPNDVTYLPKYRLAGNVTFSAQDDSGVDVYCTSDENLKVPGSNRHFQPSYQRQAMGNDCYLVNVNDNSQYDEGSKFIQALRPARPFEAYMISQTASVKPWYDIFEQMPTELRDIPVRDEEEGSERVYDLSGRQIVNSKLSKCKLHRGIYIINGKKQVMK